MLHHHGNGPIVKEYHKETSGLVCLSWATVCTHFFEFHLEMHWIRQFSAILLVVNPQEVKNKLVSAIKLELLDNTQNEAWNITGAKLESNNMPCMLFQRHGFSFEKKRDITEKRLNQYGLPSYFVWLEGTSDFITMLPQPSKKDSSEAIKQRFFGTTGVTEMLARILQTVLNNMSHFELLFDRWMVQYWRFRL